MEALARVDSFDAAQLDSITIEPALWPTSAVLDWWSILQRVDDLPDRDARRAAAEQVLRARLNLQGTTMGFSTEKADQLWWLMVSGDVNATRLLLLLVRVHAVARRRRPRSPAARSAASSTATGTPRSPTPGARSRCARSPPPSRPSR